MFKSTCITCGVFLALLSCPALVKSQIAAAAPERPVGELVELTDSKGERVSVMFRPATPTDFQVESLVVYHPRVATFLSVYELFQLDKDGNVTGTVSFGDAKLPTDYWKDLAERFVAMLDSVKADVPASLDPIRPDVQPNPNQPDFKKPFAARFNHGFVQIDVPSKTVDQVRDGTTVLYEIFPSKVTAIGMVTGEGLHMYDQIGGGKGVKYIGVTPFGPGVIIPTDPRLAAKNIAQLSINPLKQSEFYGNALKDFALKDPTLRAVAEKFGPISVAVQNVGNLHILNTTPAQAMARWTNDPAGAIPRTLGRVGDTHIGGTTPNHAVQSWTSNPRNAAVKTWKSIFH